MSLSRRYHLKKRTGELLFACARPAGNIDEGRILGLIESGVDFTYLSYLARTHRVCALVYRALRSYTPRTVTEGTAINTLRLHYLENSARNEFYKKELTAILGSFGDGKIPAIPLKGMMLSEYFYQDDVSRDQSVDIDLLVKRQDAEKARVMLEGMGYIFNPVDEKPQRQWYYLFNKSGMQKLELHWDITMMVRIRERIEEFWRDTYIAGTRGVKYYYPDPESLLIYLSIHLVNSGAISELRHSCDIVSLLEKHAKDLNWDSVIQRAGRWHAAASLYASLSLVRQIYGYMFPKDVLKAIRPSLPRRMFIRAFASKNVLIGSGPLRRRLLDFFLSYVFFELIEARSMRDYINIIVKMFSS